MSKPRTEDPYLVYCEAACFIIELIQSAVMDKLLTDGASSTDTVTKSLVEKVSRGDATDEEVSLLEHFNSVDWGDWRSVISAMREGLLVHVDADNPYVEGGKGLADLYKYEWNEHVYRKYVQLVNQQELEALVFQEGERPELLGLVSGIRSGVRILDELEGLLEAGNGIPKFYIEGKSKPAFIPENAKRLVEVSKEVFDTLMEREHILRIGTIDQEKLISNDLRVLGALVDPAESVSSVGYIADRLGISVERVTELIEKRHEIDLGGYVQSHYSYDDNKRVTYGILLGTQRYVEHLKTEYGPYATRATVQLPNPEPLDDRIPIHPKVLVYVENCFSQLKFDEDWGGLKTPIMAVDDIKDLIQSNFLTEKPLKRRTFKANIKHKGELHYFFGLVFHHILEHPDIPAEGLQPSDIVDFVWENFPDARPPKKDSLRRNMRRCPESSTGKVEERINEYLKDLKKELGI